MSYSCFSDYYDIFTDNVDYSAMADYICALFDRYGCKPESVLDAACGTGSLAIELAKRDFDMVCSDSSCEMLSVAMEKAQGLGILFLNQAMENLDLYGTVGAAVCTLDSVNHITNEKKLAEAFFKVSLFTEPGGLFIFDVNTPYKHTEILGGNSFVYETEDVMCVWQNSTDAENLLTEIDLDFFERQKDGRFVRSHENFYEKGYSFEKLEQLLSAAGLEVLGIFGENSFEPPAADCQRAVFVTRKI